MLNDVNERPQKRWKVSEIIPLCCMKWGDLMCDLWTKWATILQLSFLWQINDVTAVYTKVGIFTYMSGKPNQDHIINQYEVYILCNSVIKSCILIDHGGMNLIFWYVPQNV